MHPITFRHPTPRKRFAVRIFSAVLLSFLVLASGHAQEKRLRLDSLGLPPMPGAKSIGSIRLPLAAILKPEPGQKPTGPELTDLAIVSYRTPLSYSIDQIAAFYSEHAVKGGWKPLDDIQETANSRSLIFWSSAAPGYLTVDIVPGPEETRQIDLTRLLGDVNPKRPGEVYRLTGKRVRFQRPKVTVAGRFIDLRTGAVVNRTVVARPGQSETGLEASSATHYVPMDDTYAVVVKVTDTVGQMTAADLYSKNNTLLAHAEAKKPVPELTLVAKVRATQGLALRVVVHGVENPIVTPAPAPATKPATVAKPTVLTGTKTTAKPPAKTTAKPTAKPAPKPAPKPTPAPAPTVPEPPLIITILSEWPDLRPPLTALPSAKRGATTSKADSTVLIQDQELGSSCEEQLSTNVPWEAQTTEEFTFSPDLFGPSMPRSQASNRNGTLNVTFPKGSGSSNVFSITQTKSINTTKVSIGYEFNDQWVKLPGEKLNPVEETYTVITTQQPTVSKRSTGVCPPADAAKKD